MSDFIPKTLEIKDKSIDNAVFRGIQEMGLSIDEVDIKTVQEGTKGILGIGAKPFIVRLTQRNPNYIMQQEQRKEEIKREEKAAAARTLESEKTFERASAPAQAPVQAPLRDAQAPQRAPVSSTNDQRPVRDNRYDKQDNRNQPRDFNQSRPNNNFNRPTNQSGPRPNSDNRTPARGRPQQNQMRGNNRGNPRAPGFGPRPRRDDLPRIDNTVYAPYVAGETKCPGADFLVGLLQRMDIQADIGYFESEESIKFKINSQSMGILIGHRGETLDAMQYLTSLVVNRGAQNYRRVTLDTENYRNKREDTLVRLARKIASQVKKTGEKVELEPMNPYERRVLHATLQNNPFIETYSEGEEPKRRVIIAPKKRTFNNQSTPRS